MECGNGDEHDRVGEGGEDMHADDREEIPRLHSVCWKDHHDGLGHTGC